MSDQVHRPSAERRHKGGHVLRVLLDGEVAPDGRPMGRAIAESTFHHFADYNWDLDRGAPSLLTTSIDLTYQIPLTIGS